MKKVLHYSNVLNTVNSHNDSQRAAHVLSGYDIVILKYYPNVVGPDQDNLRINLDVIEHIHSINNQVDFYVEVDLTTAVENVTIDAVKLAYGSPVVGIAFTNCQFSGAVNRTKQKALYDDCKSVSLKTMWLSNNYEDIITSMVDSVYNPSGTALPLDPTDIVMCVRDLASTTSLEEYMFDEMLAANQKFNRNRKFGTMYLASNTTVYSGYNRELAADISSFWGHDFIGFGIVGNYSGSDRTVTLSDIDTRWAPSSSNRYRVATNSSVRREDGVVLSFPSGSTNISKAIVKR